MTENENEEKKSFAELFESTSENPGCKLFPGETVSGRVVKISKGTIFVDLGVKVNALQVLQNSWTRMGTLTSGKEIGLR